MVLVQTMVKSGPEVSVISSQWRNSILRERTAMVLSMPSFSTC